MQYAILASIVRTEQPMNSESIPRNDVTTIFLLQRKIGSALEDARSCPSWVVISSVYPVRAQRDAQQQWPYPFHIKYMESPATAATDLPSDTNSSRIIQAGSLPEPFLWIIKLIGSMILSRLHVMCMCVHIINIYKTIIVMDYLLYFYNITFKLL